MKTPPFYPVFLTILICCAAFSLLAPKQSTSASENRTLQEAPQFSFAQVCEGTFQSRMESYVQDHMFLRDGWMKLQRSLLYASGIKEIQNVYIGDGQLYQKPEPYDSADYAALAKQMNTWAKQMPDLRYDLLLIPTANLILQEHFMMPSLLGDEQAQRDWFYGLLEQPFHTMETITPFQIEQPERLYYQGDHHWTSEGAYRMYQAWAAVRGFQIPKFTPMIVNDAFYGTLSNASGIAVRDQISIYESDANPTYLVTYVEEQEKSPSVYNAELQYSANPYELFFGGNHARIDIETTAQTDRSLLIIKDSYANCFIPFLLSHYRSITVIDPRYYYDELSTLIKEKDISDVMFLYNIATFFSDSSLRNVLQEELQS